MPATTATVEVRRLRPDDLESVIALDARITGRRREEYFRVKLDQALKETGIQVSLAAERDGMFAGFLLCRVFYGEFGAMEPSAVLETLGVHPGFRGHGIGRALLRQLRTNLLGLGLGALHTEVDWNSQDLLRFFHSVGMEPAKRLCLDWDLEAARRADDLGEPGDEPPA